MRWRLPTRLVLVALLAARVAAAHSVPVFPSRCAFDPVQLALPARGASATVDPPAPGDTVRTIYDLQDWTAQFAAETASAPRAFALDGVAGALGMPHFFVASILSTGDFVAPGAPLAFTVGGATTTVPVRLSTGLAGLPGLVVAGTPLDGVGHFEAVGVVPGGTLPAFGSDPLVVRVACVAIPRPDRDQFRRATETLLDSGTVRDQGTLAIRAIFAPARGIVPDFAGASALFQASAAGQTIAAGVLPGLRQRGRKQLFVGTSADRSVSIGVRFLRKRFDVENWLLAVKLRNASVPRTAGRRVTVDVTWDVGGLLSRTSAVFRANTRGTKLVLR
jgi:hypothetical protein